MNARGGATWQLGIGGKEYNQDSELYNCVNGGREME